MAHTLPKTAHEALSKFLACKPVKGLLGDRFVKALYIVKSAELEAYQNVTARGSARPVVERSAG
jgi:glutamine synthetase